MRKTVLLLAMVAAALLMTGCSEPKSQGGEAERQNPSKGEQTPPKQEKTVVVKERTVLVNEGMSKKEEKKLQKRLDDLEKKVDDKPPQETANQGISTQDAESVEDQALEAAQDYYAAAAAGNYTYTYAALSSAAQSQFTEEDWVAANTALGSDAAVYHIDSANVVDDSTVVVYLTITSADGSSSERVTQFVLEDGSWKHELTQDEYALFATATATATASSAPSSASSGSGRVAPLSQTDCPASAPIKGNVSSSGELIYHTQSSATYDETHPEECFATDDAAQAAGYRAARD